MNQAIQNPLQETTLEVLAATYNAEKAKLAIAQKNLRLAEKALVAAVGAKDEGSFTVASDSFKVTTTQPISRTVDPIRARQIVKELPRDIADAIFTWKPALSVRVYKELERYQPDTFKIVAKAVTAKPGKVSVKVEAAQ